jgi:hypothetical protein
LPFLPKSSRTDKSARNAAKLFSVLSCDLQNLLGTATIFKSTDYRSAPRISDPEEYNNLLAAIQKACDEHGLSHTAEMAKRAAQREPATYDNVYHSLTHLNDSLTSELGTGGHFSHRA